MNQTEKDEVMLDEEDQTENKKYYYGITKKVLKNMADFKYKCNSNSLLYNHIISPACNQIVKIIPMSLAPNILTFISLLLNVLSLIFVIIFETIDHNKPIPRWIILYFGIELFIYVILDNLDGKQARRTNSSTTLGLLLDHGTDAMSASMIAIIMCRVFNIERNLKSFVIFFFLNFSFWTATYEELQLGFLTFGYFSGPDEGLLLLSIAAIFTFIFYENNIWNTAITSGFSVDDLILILILTASMYICFSSLWNLKSKKGFKSIVNFLGDSWLILSVQIFPILNYLFLLNKGNFSEYVDLILYLMGLMTARIIIGLLIDITGNRQFSSNCTTVIVVYVLSLICLCLNLILKDFSEGLKICYTVIVLGLLVAFLHYVIYLVYIISSKLNLSVFTLDKKQVEQENTKVDLI